MKQALVYRRKWSTQRKICFVTSTPGLFFNYTRHSSFSIFCSKVIDRITLDSFFGRRAMLDSYLTPLMFFQNSSMSLVFKQTLRGEILVLYSWISWGVILYTWTTMNFFSEYLKKMRMSSLSLIKIYWLLMFDGSLKLCFSFSWDDGYIKLKRFSINKDC